MADNSPIAGGLHGIPVANNGAVLAAQHQKTADFALRLPHRDRLDREPCGQRQSDGNQTSRTDQSVACGRPIYSQFMFE